VQGADLIEALSKLTQERSSAVSEIETAATECIDKKSEPTKMIALADAFSAKAQSLVQPLEHIDTAEILRGSIFGGPNSLTHIARDEILAQLRVDKSTASVIRDPSCALFPSGCKAPPQFSALDDALKKLVAGNVAFNNPQRMTVSRPNLVEVKLSTTLSPSQLKAQLTEEGGKEVEGLSVGDRMSATLNGGAAFDIAPSGPQTQWISQTNVTTWTWNVTPKLSGTQYLILSFDAVISINGKDGIRNVRTLTHEIQVDVGWPTSLEEWFDFSKKWFENISWLWASVLVPVGLIIAGWWHRRASRRRA